MNSTQKLSVLTRTLFLILVLAPLNCLGQSFGDRLTKAIFGQPSVEPGQGDYIGGRRGYVEGAGTVSSMECYELGGRDHKYPAEVYQSQRDLARSPNHPFAPRRLQVLARACGPLPHIYTHEEHQVWLKENEERNARFRDAYEGSAIQKRDQALLRLLEPYVEGDTPGSHDCNQSEKQQYANAKKIVEGGYNSGYSKDEIDGAHLTIGLIENRCGAL